MPDIKFPNLDVEKAATDFNNALKEAAYVAVGLGVLGFQRAQVQRVELMKQLDDQIGYLSGLSSTFNGSAETYLAAARQQLTDARDQLVKLSSEVIPTDIADPAAVRSSLTELAKSVDEAVAPVRQQFEEQLDRLEEVLPQTARDLVQSVRGAAASQEHALRNAVGLS
jgi:predicted  nucleic acid-binding Zn-ribbon protein